jgi:hypothetical protein
LSSVKESLAEDWKLSAYGRQPSLSSLIIWSYLFCFYGDFQGSVYCSSLGEHSLTLWPTCIAHSILYFWSHWGQCFILVWGWGRHFCLLFLLFCCYCFCEKKKKEKKKGYVVDWAWLHLTVVCISLVCLTCQTLYIVENLKFFDSSVGLERLRVFELFITSTLA